MNVETRRTLFGLYVLLIIMFGRFPTLARWMNQAWHYVAHDVPPANVFYTPEPSDCDFIRSPIGLKGCHYEKVVSVAYNKNENFATIVWRKETE